MLASYPNPFSGSTTILIELAEPQIVRLVVYNALGRTVQSENRGLLREGRHRLKFDSGGLPSGAYLYHLDAAGAGVTGMLLKRVRN